MQNSDFYLLAHLSDLHLTSKRMDYFRGLLGNKKLNECDYILITGDIRDTSKVERLIEIFETLEPLKEKILPVPGNHDINLDMVKVGRNISKILLKIWRYIRITNPEVWIITKIFNDLIDTISDNKRYNINYRQLFKMISLNELSLMQVDPGQKISKISRIKRDLFLLINDNPQAASTPYPMYKHLDENLTIVLLDSTYKGMKDLGINNAFGVIGDVQLKRLERFFAQNKQRKHIILLHHHVQIPQEVKEKLKGLNKMMFDVSEQFLKILLDDRDKLVDLCGKYNVTAIFNGHRHWDYETELDGIKIVSAPSTTMGNELEGYGKPYFKRFRLYKGSGMVEYHDTIELEPLVKPKQAKTDEPA